MHSGAVTLLFPPERRPTELGNATYRVLPAHSTRNVADQAKRLSQMLLRALFTTWSALATCRINPTTAPFETDIVAYYTLFLCCGLFA